MSRWWGSGNGCVKVVVAIVTGDGCTNDAGGKVVIVVIADGRIDNAGGGVVVVVIAGSGCIDIAVVEQWWWPH